MIVSKGMKALMILQDLVSGTNQPNLSPSRQVVRRRLRKKRKLMHLSLQDPQFSQGKRQLKVEIQEYYPDQQWESKKQLLRPKLHPLLLNVVKSQRQMKLVILEVSEQILGEALEVLVKPQEAVVTAIEVVEKAKGVVAMAKEVA